MEIRLPPSSLVPLLERGRFGEIADELANSLYLNLSPEETLGIQKTAKQTGESHETSLHAYCTSLLENENRPFLKKAIKEKRLLLRCLSPLPYQENPYYKLLSVLISEKEKKRGPYSLEFQTLPGFVPFSFCSKTFLEGDPLEDQTQLGFFSSDFSFPCLKQKNRIWMSLVPHEIETMKEPLEKMKGNVLTLGCGLGYFAFQAAEKKEVASVTIVEKDPRVLSLFSSFLMPYFPHKGKIRLIQKDALEYLENTSERFDSSFSDLWHDVEDGLPLYLRLLPFQKEMGEASYWIESDMLVYLRRHVLALLEEEINGSGDENYQEANNFSDALINALHFHLKNYPITNEQDLFELLSEKSLKAIARNLKIAQ